MKSPIPGLTRGLQVLRLLTSPMTLEEIVRKTQIPRTTVMRILATLRADGVISKNETTRTFLATMHLTPAESEGVDDFERALDSALARLASETGHTSEWYLPTPSGHVLARRYTPPNAEIHVRSWIGLVRFWSGHLDAVTCIGRARWLTVPKPGEKFWVYGPACQRLTISNKDVRRMMTDATIQGYAAEEHFNEGGVKRIACAVMRQKLPVGILTLAQCNIPGLASQSERNLSILIREASSLSQIAEEKLARIEPWTERNIEKGQEDLTV